HAFAVLVDTTLSIITSRESMPPVEMPPVVRGGARLGGACFRRSRARAGNPEPTRRKHVEPAAHWWSPIQPRQWIHFNRHRPDPRIKPGARPYPVRCLLHEPAPHGVVVNVLDHLQQSGRLDHVTVVAAAALPEAIMHLAVGLHILQLFQKP